MSRMQNPGIILPDSSKFRNGYFNEMLQDDDSDYKKQQRWKVNLFLLQHKSKGYPDRFLTFPGGAWSFERGFVSAKDLWFVGLEKEQFVFDRSVAWLPGLRRREVKLPCKYPQGSVSTVLSESAIALHCHLSAFVILQLASVGHNSLYSSALDGITGSWLDFNSCICYEMIQALPFLGNALSKDCPVVPVAVSYMACREIKSVTKIIGGKTRAEYVLSLLNKSDVRRFKPLDIFAYVSHGGCRMETLFTEARLY